MDALYFGDSYDSVEGTMESVDRACLGCGVASTQDYCPACAQEIETYGLDPEIDREARLSETLGGDYCEHCNQHFDQHDGEYCQMAQDAHLEAQLALEEDLAQDDAWQAYCAAAARISTWLAEARQALEEEAFDRLYEAWRRKG